MSIVRGFQEEIREKVIGFGSHFQVVSNDEGITKDSQSLLFQDSIYQALKSVPGVKHVQVYATKPGILETSEALQGIIIKGIDRDFDWTFFDTKLIEGSRPDSDSSAIKYELIISKYLSQRLKLKVGDKVSLYVVNNNADARQRNFTICGIYETGLQEYDKQYVFTDLAHVRKLSGWGLQAQILADTVCTNGYITIGALAFGGDGDYHYIWNVPGWRGEGPFYITPDRDTTIKVILRDGLGTLPDTAMVTIDFADDNTDVPCRPFSVRTATSGGSQDHYIGGYEILIKDFDQLMTMDDELYQAIPFYLTTQKITDRSADIFAWLTMLDLNVIVIIVLMIVISIVNMTSALLILILERQNMIGTLKALGSSDRSVAGVFLINAAYIIGKGLLWGNILAFAFIFLQSQFGIIQLDQENYFVDQVPVQWDLLSFVVVDAGTIVVCLLFLLLPALYVTRISPVKAMRFN
jgi:lipoprotein-releasing system permease protein